MPSCCAKWMLKEAFVTHFYSPFIGSCHDESLYSECRMAGWTQWKSKKTCQAAAAVVDDCLEPRQNSFSHEKRKDFATQVRSPNGELMFFFRFLFRGIYQLLNCSLKSRVDEECAKLNSLPVACTSSANRSCMTLLDKLLHKQKQSSVNLNYPWLVGRPEGVKCSPNDSSNELQVFTSHELES